MCPLLPATPATQLDLRGCNQLEALQLGCPALRSVDATFCSKLRCAGACGCLPVMQPVFSAASARAAADTLPLPHTHVQRRRH